MPKVTTYQYAAAAFQRHLNFKKQVLLERLDMKDSIDSKRLL